ncbi:MAG: flagellar hook-associated protein FlgK [Desulfobacterales bacterium]|jgi:flagellar hook-associated protein 1 FlgK|nr:flagellar hook-associated protein FlgK [Desulfobacterales bacterium]
MTHLFGVLSTATSALLTQQRAINVTGNNIANVNTPGYSRQRLNLETGMPTQTGLGMMSYGVTSTDVERVYDRFLGVQLNNENANLGRWEAQKGMLDRVEVVFDESGGYGLNQALSDFWNSWQDLSLKPEGQTERAVVAATSQGLADAIRQKYGGLEQVQKDIDIAVRDGVETVNRLAAQIADLNQKIARTEIGGTNANDYRDRRDLILKQLSEMIDITSFEDATGQAVVSVGAGRPLVESGNTWQLSAQTNADGHTDIFWPDVDGGLVSLSGEIRGGRIGGWLQTRDAKIAGYQSDLDALAQGLMGEVNTLHAAGYGLDGTTDTDLFTGSGAADMQINPAVLADLNLIAASAPPGAYGNADQAIAINALRTGLTMNGGTSTFDAAANALVSQVGYDVQTAKANAGHQADMTTYLENYRESVSGVSLDEEMVNLVKFEAAYNAAAKMVSMADEMLDSLMNMVR